MSAEGLEKLTREIDEQMIVSAILNKSRRGEIISETAIFYWLGIGKFSNPPRLLRLKVKRLLKSLSENGILVKRRELHFAASGKRERAYDLSH